MCAQIMKYDKRSSRLLCINPCINPLTRLAAIILLTSPVLLSVDWVSSLVVIAGSMIMSLFMPLQGKQLWHRIVPLIVVAPLSAVSMLLYASSESYENSVVYAHFLAVTITDHSISLALSTFFRVLAIGIPVIVCGAGMDSAELGRALAQNLHLPARFVLAATSALRLTSVLRRDYELIIRARRARGLGDTHRIGAYCAVAFSVMVAALRRGNALSTAMEARGMKRLAPSSAGYTRVVRTWRVRETYGYTDVVFLLAVLVIVVCAIALAVVTHHYSFLFGMGV